MIARPIHSRRLALAGGTAVVMEFLLGWLRHCDEWRGRISTARARPDMARAHRRGRGAAGSAHDEVDEPGDPRVGWPEPVAGIETRLPQHRQPLAHRIEARAAVVGAHAAGADAAERQAFGGEMQQCVVDGDAAGEGAVEDAFDLAAVVAEGVQRQWPRPRAY